MRRYDDEYNDLADTRDHDPADEYDTERFYDDYDDSDRWDDGYDTYDDVEYDGPDCGS